MNIEHPRARHIICLGNDELLLQTRKWVLERAFQVTLVHSLSQLRARLADAPIDLVVLCQTLSSEESNDAAALVHRRFPSCIILKMLRPFDAASLETHEARLDPSSGPRVLLEHVSILLQDVTTPAR